MSNRPAKRRRTDTNMFMDLEAIADDVLEDDELTDGEEELEDEMDEEETRWDSVVNHARLRQAMADTWSEEAHLLADLARRATRRAAMEQGTSTEDAGFQSEYAAADYTLFKDDNLWEIGCKLGRENAAVFKILHLAFHPTSPQSLARSVMANPCRPGRIYAEVSTHQQAMRLATSVSELNKAMLRPVPREEWAQTRIVGSPNISRQSWGRVRGKRKGWEHYRGDVGLVEKDRLSRPTQALSLKEMVESTFGEETVEMQSGGSYRFEGRQYSKKGFLMVNISDIDLMYSVDPLPSMSVLMLFSSNDVLEADARVRTENGIMASQVKLHDRVKVVRGEYRGLLGQVEDVGENEIAVYLSTQDLTENVLRTDVRLAFRVGDEVRVLDGPNSGLTGWVVDIFDDRMKILNMEKQAEFTVSSGQVVFYSSDFVATTLRPRNPKLRNQLGGKDPNGVYKGKRVIVIGSHAWKGYKGLIKDTSPLGKAWVELEACLQRVVELSLGDLAFLHPDERSLTFLTYSGTSTHPPQEVPPPPPLPRTQDSFAYPIELKRFITGMGPLFSNSTCRKSCPGICDGGFSVRSANVRGAFDHWLHAEALIGIRVKDTPSPQQSLPSVGIYSYSSTDIDQCDQMLSTVFGGLDEHVSCICIPLHIAEYKPLSGKDHMPLTPNVSSKYCPTVGELYINEDYMVWAFDHASRMLCLWVARVAMLDIYRVTTFSFKIAYETGYTGSYGISKCSWQDIQ
ncbi:hypothetical protein BDZ97DRAFT_1921993 [Flammula alnicola]|nr:hypothetical protein BDZ97DRAFT_1921993 [Flammula alnicola]